MEFKEISEEKIIELSKSRNEPEWLTNFRLISFKKFFELPSENSPLYSKYSRFIEFDLNEINPDINSEKNIKVKFREGPIEISDIFTALRNNSELQKYFNYLLEDKFLCLNNAIFNSGVFVYVPEDIEADFPIEFFYRISNSSIFSKNIFLLDKNSKLTVLENKSSEAKNQNICSISSNFILKESSELTFSSLEKFDDNVINLSYGKSFFERDSKATFTSAVFGGNMTKSKFEYFLQNKGASVEYYHILSGNKKQKFDFESNSYHNSEFTKSFTISRSVLSDDSQAVIKGKINISKQAKSSEAYLSGHSLVLNKGASADIIPSLEIETNEVKATHSASVSQLDDEQLFYLQSRGLEGELAKNLLILSFFEPVINRITNDEILKIILESIEENVFRKKDVILPEIKNKIIKDAFERHYKYR